MSVDPQVEWEQTYSDPMAQHKNKYPSTEVVSFVLRHFGRQPDRSQIRILDIGCGWGNNLRFLIQEGFDGYGIDFSKSAIQACAQEFKNVVAGDVSDLPYPDAFFDCVIDRQAIQHNSKEKIDQIFKEVSRVLKPGGKFFSVMVSQADYKHATSYLTDSEVAQAARVFQSHTLDYVEMSANSKRDIFRLHHIVAIK